ncbi:thiamine phosphate synthase [Devosia rhodophyticola]|uniref:Thiamine phosphate synthase n=1 Tax=Devosia rhodophyticola TaxID=3026423 RepID=A0ABY7YU56_9HYPH|nr:thiamine phosphate synthase [Devosia rhodophyticola]WDR04911.1 thiamine phosphate synthase [Devosia rhodophyticola]
MAAQIYLLTPPNAEPTRFPALLQTVLAANPVSALLVRRHDLSPAAYETLVKALLPIAQSSACALLVEDDSALAISLGADGVHVGPDIKTAKAAIAAAKPALIVGVGPCDSRHDAMILGELNIDYLLFGPLEQNGKANGAELAQWWAQTFEIPAVLSAPDAGADLVDALGAEFLALSQSLWQREDPAAFLTTFFSQQEA